ncbi:unnamed protein product [Acanthoscelides obtectus]|uniref:Cytochrome P450 n=1 Tax=Acanthoscelides obtectus TaxID=200917 RepID=A0A9P0LYC6_ACAOB|nr:unnamed protein product [Acanthoscelides obtectus]CAK1665061.1 Cytochrome P450 6k1 [Acanthoscelides obtectus]
MLLLKTSVPVDIAIFTVLAIYILYKYATRNFKYFKDTGVPYIEPMPFFGNFASIALFRRSIGEWLRSCYEKMDAPYFGIFVFNTPCMVIKSPELVRDCLIKDFSHFHDRSTPLPKHEQLQQGMMLLQKGREWKETREKFTNAFTSGKLRQMFPELNTYAEKLVKFIKNNDTTKIDIQDCSLRYSTDTLLRSFVGVESYCLDEDSEIYTRMKSAMSVTLEGGVRGISFFFRLDNLIESLKLCFPQRAALDFFADVFQYLVKLSKETKGKISNLIDIVNSLKSNESYTKKFTYGDRKAVGQPFMFFIAGENTLITTLTYTLYELAKHPEVQVKLRNEVTEAKGDDTQFSYEKIIGMKYMEMIIQEVMRMYPPLPFIDRECTKDYKIRGTDVIIPKGQQVYIPMLGFNFDESIFPEPEKFIPERFESKSRYNQNGIRFFPFGDGPRICIGECAYLVQIIEKL